MVSAYAMQNNNEQKACWKCCLFPFSIVNVKIECIMYEQFSIQKEIINTRKEFLLKITLSFR